MPRFLRARFILALALSALAFILLPAVQNGTAALAERTFTGRVVSITDGDTIVVLDGREQRRVRLYGIDCPERAQAFGTRARQFTGELAFANTVSVRVRDVDRYGRTVGEVILPDGRNLNHELVRAGLAWWYRQYARGDITLERLEAEARATKRGLWADANPIAPWGFRSRQRRRAAVR